MDHKPLTETPRSASIFSLSSANLKVLYPTGSSSAKNVSRWYGVRGMLYWSRMGKSGCKRLRINTRSRAQTENETYIRGVVAAKCYQLVLVGVSLSNGVLALIATV